MSYQTTVVLMKEKDWYVARSIELGVTTQGKTIEEAQANLKEAVGLYLEDRPEDKSTLPVSGTAPLVTTLAV